MPRDCPYCGRWRDDVIDEVLCGVMFFCGAIVERWSEQGLCDPLDAEGRSILDEGGLMKKI